MATEVKQPTAPALRDQLINAVRTGYNWIVVNGETLTLEQGIGILDDETIGPLFVDLANDYNTRYNKAENDQERKEVKKRFRSLLGPRYSCLLLTSVTPTISSPSTGSIWAVSLKSCVEESLQWHKEAVFAEALIYFSDGKSPEKLFHECAVVRPETSDAAIEKGMGNFLIELEGYIKEWGTSVKTKAHLRLIALPSDENKNPVSTRNQFKSIPLLEAKSLLFYQGDLKMPTEKTGIGNQDRFNEIVQQTLGESLELVRGSFDVVHYSAGSDAINDDSVRATAHLYIVFQKGASVALDYAIAMRETLGRITVAFALERVQMATNDLIESQEREQTQHNELTCKVKELSEEIRNLQAKTDEVIALLAPSVWRCIRDWIPVIGRLFDNKGSELIRIGGLAPIGPDHEWQEEQYAAALLALVNYIYKGPDSSRPSSYLDVWFDESARVRNDLGVFRNAHPLWRSLERLGVLEASAARSLDSVKDVLGDRRLKTAFLHKSNLFSSNAFTILCLQLAIGATKDNALGYASPVFVDHALRVDIILDGLNLLHDTLTAKSLCGAQAVKMVLLGDYFTITFRDPRATEFSELCDQMAEFGRAHPRKHPGHRLGSMTMSTFAALGLNEESWAEAIGSVEFDRESRLVFIRNDKTEKIASCQAADDSISLTYKTRNS